MKRRDKLFDKLWIWIDPYGTSDQQPPYTSHQQRKLLQLNRAYLPRYRRMQMNLS